jgi:hypothetical protein
LIEHLIEHSIEHLNGLRDRQETRSSRRGMILRLPEIKEIRNKSRTELPMMTRMARLLHMPGDRGLRAAVAVALLAAAACSDKAKQQATADSALVRDLALAGQQTAQPTFQDTAVAPAPAKAAAPKKEVPAPVRTHSAPEPKPRTPRQVAAASPTPPPTTPAPAPVQQAPIPAPVAAAPTPAPAPVQSEIGAGTAVALTSGSKVCTSTNLPGDKLVATTNEAITGSNGAVIPSGSTVVLEVASVSPGDDANGASITFRVRSVVVNDKTYNVAADVISLGQLDRTKVANSDPNADKKKVIGGAIAGALIGQILGHSTKGTIIGAAAGAATGAAVAKTGQKWEGCLPAGAPMRLTLSSVLVMS